MSRRAAKRAERNQNLLDHFHSGGQGPDDEAPGPLHDATALEGGESDPEPRISEQGETAN